MLRWKDMGTLLLSPRSNLERGLAILFVCDFLGTSTGLAHITAVRFLDIYQVTQALNTVLTNQKQLSEMRRSWQKVDFESVRNQSALVCNCRHEELVQLLEVDFVGMMDSLAKTPEPVREVMAWADKCCERLMGQRIGTGDDRGTMSSRSVLIRWGYVTSQVMRDLVSAPLIILLPFTNSH